MTKLLAPYLQEMITSQASDLFMTTGSAPSLRIDEIIYPFNAPPLNSSDMDVLINDVLNEEQRDEFQSTLELNIALSGAGGNHFRVNIFRQMQNTGMVIRLIKSRMPTIDELGLPPVYREFIMGKRGLVLLVGSTGSGKSTSVAAMLNYRNENGQGHIITVEDPIEFVHQHKKCIFTQREIGMDTYSYGIALKNALRQSPDVMVIGEIRDRETLESAMLFCETGHLVVATLHASNANKAIERIMNLFPEELQQQMLSTLAQNLRAIASQRLVESLGQNGRMLAYEILINEGLIKSLIESCKIDDLKEVMEKNIDQGMITFDQCLLSMVERNKISPEVALREADSASNMRLKLNQMNIASTLRAVENNPNSLSANGINNNSF